MFFMEVFLKWVYFVILWKFFDGCYCWVVGLNGKYSIGFDGMAVDEDGISFIIVGIVIYVGIG